MRFPSLPKLRLYLPLITLLGTPAFSCGPGPGGNAAVVHPEPDQPNTIDYCKDQQEKERSCSHCVSKPGCGWVEDSEGSCVPGDRNGPADSSVLAGGGTWSGTLDSCPQPDPVSSFESGKIDAPAGDSSTAPDDGTAPAGDSSTAPDDGTAPE